MVRLAFSKLSVKFYSEIINNMTPCYEGSLAVGKNQLSLDVTLLGGQSFRWIKVEGDKKPTEWRGVAYNAYWTLQMNDETVVYKVHPAPSAAKQHSAEHYENLLANYFRLDFDLLAHIKQWKKSHQHFSQINNTMKAVRVLNQEPLENILSFICSQNNNIKRISSMVNWLCSEYGEKIGTFNDHDEFTFPTLDALVERQKDLENNLRNAKFGYRAKFISQTVAKISENGGNQWFEKLRNLPYTDARLQLVALPGIGFKVADCVCLMSLGHLEAVPIDTHIFQIAKSSYMPELSEVKSVTPKIYDDISSHFRRVYGAYAGWAQAVLFCSGLQQFQTKTKSGDKTVSPVAAKKRKS